MLDLEGLKSSSALLSFCERKEVKVGLSDVVEKGLKKMGVTISKPVLGILTLVFGILILAYEPILRWAVAIFLIIQGILLLTEYYELQSRPTPKT